MEQWAWACVPSSVYPLRLHYPMKTTDETDLLHGFSSALQSSSLHVGWWIKHEACVQGVPQKDTTVSYNRWARSAFDFTHIHTALLGVWKLTVFLEFISLPLSFFVNYAPVSIGNILKFVTKNRLAHILKNGLDSRSFMQAHQAAEVAQIHKMLLAHLSVFNRRRH